MAIPISLKQYLSYHHAEYQIVKHPKTTSSLNTAQVAHIPGDQIVKSVVLEDEDGYLMAVLPASRRVEVGKLSKLTKRRLGLATEPELDQIFADCKKGAVPPVGRAYGVDTIWDDSISVMHDVYFEAGDHKELVHMTNLQYRRLMEHNRHGDFSRHI